MAQTQDIAAPALRPLVARSLLLLGLLTAIDALSIDSYIPALPGISAELRVSAVEVQGTLSLFLLGVALGQSVWGPLSDRFGRRLPLLAGLVVFCLGSLGCALADRIAILTTARLVQAVGASSGLVLARAIVADVWPPERTARIYSLLMQVLGVTALVSPLAGAGLLQLAGWRSIFLALALIGLASLAWSARGIPETLPPARRSANPDFLGGYGALLRSGPFVLACLATSLGTATMFATLSGSSFLFIAGFGWSSSAFSLLYAGSSLVFIAVCRINEIQLRRRSAASLLRLGVSVQLATALAMTALLPFDSGVQAWGFALGWLVLMANLGILLGNSVAIAMDFAAPEQAGSASALIGIAQFALSALVAPLATSLADLSWSFALTTLGCAALAWLTTVLALRHRA